MALRAYIHPEAEKATTVLVYGSTDGRNWRLIAGRKPTGTHDDIILGRCGYSVKYLMIQVGGRWLGDSYISNMELKYIERLNNKYR